jgi:hypothetical protein
LERSRKEFEMKLKGVLGEVYIQRSPRKFQKETGE